MYLVHKILKILNVHSSDEVYDYKTQFEEWKIQLTMSINFISSKDSDGTCNMHTQSNNIEIMVGSETDEIIEEFFKSLLQKYQEELEEPMRGSEFTPDSVNLLHYHLQKTSLKKNRIIIYRFSRMVKNKKATINPKNNDDNCFKYTLTVALNLNKLKITLKKYVILSLLLISITGKE